MRPAHLLLPLLLLTACKPGGTAGNRAAGGEDLIARTLFTATGSFDAQADSRERIGGGLRRATWISRPPLDAQGVVVQYDSDARPLSWRLDIRSPRFTAQELAGPDAQAVTTPQGEALHPATGSRLGDTLILTTATGVRVITRGYATQEDAALLPAFRR